MEETNLLIMTGNVTIKPIWAPGYNGSIDFEIKNREGFHQVVSVEPDIIKNRQLIKGRVKVTGKVVKRKEDWLIMAQRVEME